MIFETKIKMALKYILFVLLGLLIFYGGIFFLQGKGFQFSYQQSKSMPEGIYFIYPTSRYLDGQNILFWPNKASEKHMIKRGYIRQKTPLLKQIVGINGDKVCIKDHKLYIDGAVLGPVYQEDRKGRPLEQLQICRNLNVNEFFVMGVSSPKSYDSRYYGMITKSQIIGKAKLLWSR